MSVTNKVKEWDAEFVIIYQESGTELNPDWGKNNFKALSSLDWQTVLNEIGFSKPFKMPHPKWWLLKVPKK